MGKELGNAHQTTSTQASGKWPSGSSLCLIPIHFSILCTVATVHVWASAVSQMGLLTEHGTRTTQAS